MSKWDRVLNLIYFMLGCLKSIDYDKTHPMTYSHIIREMNRCDIEVKNV